MIPKGRKGLTLIEIMISLSIMGVIMVPVSLLFYTGYSNYYYENDDMINIQKSREVMDSIMGDLRMNDSSLVCVKDEGNTLYIKESLVYTYSSMDSKLLKNGVSLFAEDDQVSINYFKVEEIKPEEYDSSLINITIKMKVNRSAEITLQNSYRRKSVQSSGS